MAARREAERMRDWSRSAPGQKGVKLDWEATWRNWVRKAIEERGRSTVRRVNGAPVPGERKQGQDGRTVEWAGADGWVEVRG